MLSLKLHKHMLCVCVSVIRVQNENDNDTLTHSHATTANIKLYLIIDVDSAKSMFNAITNEWKHVEEQRKFEQKTSRPRRRARERETFETKYIIKMCKLYPGCSSNTKIRRFISVCLSVNARTKQQKTILDDFEGTKQSFINSVHLVVSRANWNRKSKTKKKLLSRNLNICAMRESDVRGVSHQDKTRRHQSNDPFSSFKWERNKRTALVAAEKCNKNGKPAHHFTISFENEFH